MFSDLIGNENVKTSLRHLAASGRVPNSLLFTGPDGIGKKRFAFDLARTLLCQKKSGIDECGKCSSCVRVNTFIPPISEKKDDYKRVFFDEHADVGLVVPFNRSVLIDSIRALEREAHFRPFESNARIFIIDDAYKMNDEASNALLKTLEEPAETTYIILITSRPDALLPTIRSRCQTIRFAPVDSNEIESFLITSNAISRDDAKLVARLSNGSVARAATFDLARFRVQRDMQLKVVEQSFVSSDRPSLIRSSEQMNDAKNKELFEENIEILESIVRDIWLIRNRLESSRIKNVDIIDRIQNLANATSRKKLAECLSEIELLRQSLAVNINRKLATESLFMKMSA